MSFSITYNSFRRIKLIRYLVVWRVNSSLVALREHFAPELSHVLGSIISNRLPSREGVRWQKALSSLHNYFDTPLTQGQSLSQSTAFPDVSWPIEAVLFVYPGKTTYGFGELIFWELKLFGDAADHGFFLETILPAMEEAGYTSNENWSRPNRIWGRFDIQAVYAARGPHWEPVVSDGQLDLRSQASAFQWAEGLTFGSHVESPLRQLIWVTPFEFERAGAGKERGCDSNPDHIPDGRGCTMKAILDELESRLNLPAPGRRRRNVSARDVLGDEGILILQEAMEQAIRTPLLFKDLKPAPKAYPGLWTGRYVFEPIPKAIIACLELASILHIGKYIHFGCGTFTLA